MGLLIETTPITILVLTMFLIRARLLINMLRVLSQVTLGFELLLLVARFLYGSFTGRETSEYDRESI
jgi:hypothetical protein